MPHSKPSETSKKRIYSEIRRSVIMGHRKPGERLDPDALATNYGTSVTPVRDALQMLSQEGLVHIKPRSGYFVTRITLKQLRDMLELREILEVASIERAAVRITDEQIEQLERINTRYGGEDDDFVERYATGNRRFHCLIAEASGNQELVKALGRLHDRLARYMVMGRTEETIEERHVRLIEALRTRDVAMARQRMLEELDQTREITMERVIQEEGASWRLGTQAAQEAARE